MKFTKPALTVEHQLDLLIRRGMRVSDVESAKHHLRHIGYYRLRAYWLPNEMAAPTSGDHAFAPDTTLEAVLDLYSFDRKLRLLVMDAIERTEVSLRSRWAYVLSLRYGSHGYLDPRLFRRPTEHAKSLESLKREIDRSHETFVRHYRGTYTEPALPPFWSICELLSFGQLSLWYQNLADGADRVAIAEPFGVDEQILKSFAHHLTYVRNVCAHHSRLWNREMTVGMKIPTRPLWLGEALNREKPKRLYNTLVMLAFMLDIISPGSRWRRSLLELMEEHKAVNLELMGFPQGWQDSPIWTLTPSEASP